MGPAVALIAWLAGAATWAAWVWQDHDGGARQWLGGVVLLVCGIVAWLQLREPLRGLLDWDGGQWVWFCGHQETVVRLTPAVDLQRWLLVRLEPFEGPARGGWLWLSRGADAEHWRSLRRAVYFVGRTEGPPEGLASNP